MFETYNYYNGESDDTANEIPHQTELIKSILLNYRRVISQNANVWKSIFAKIVDK